MFTKDISIVASKLNRKLNVTALEIFFNEYKILDKQFAYLLSNFSNQHQIIKEIIINTLFQVLYNITLASSKYDSASLKAILSGNDEYKAVYKEIINEFERDVAGKWKIPMRNLQTIRHCLLSHLTQGNENQNINKLVKFVQGISIDDWWTFLTEWFFFLKKICKIVDNKLNISVEWKQEP